MKCLKKSVSWFICRELDSGGRYNNFSSVFDTIEYRVLNILFAYDLKRPILILLQSYLIQRQKYVFYNGVQSGEIHPTTGVPQESNFGPLLFILYINNLQLSLPSPVLHMPIIWNYVCILLTMTKYQNFSATCVQFWIGTQNIDDS